MLITALLLLAISPAQAPAEKPPQPASKPPVQAPAASAPAAQSPTAPRPPATRPTLTVLVTDRQGKPLPNVTVKASGPVEREGSTDAEGTVLLRNLSAGTYRLRFDHSAFLAFEREVTAQLGRPLKITAELSPAPPPPPPPPPPAPEPAPTPAAPPPAVRPSGPPTLLDIPDFAEKNSKSSTIGCTGTSTATLLQLKDPLAQHAHDDADEMLYVVAGSGTQRIGTMEMNLVAGTFAVVPRGTPHSIARRGSRPLIILSIVSGPPCESAK